MGFTKPIETNFDGEKWTAFAKYGDRFYISEADSEDESRDSLVTMVANRIVFGEKPNNQNLPVL